MRRARAVHVLAVGMLAVTTVASPGSAAGGRTQEAHKQAGLASYPAQVTAADM